MKKFLVLYMANSADFEAMMKNSTPEQQKKGMEAWMKWMGDHKASLVEGGAPLGKTKRVDSKGASDTKNDVGGYSIVQADTADAATKMFGKDHPHLQMSGAWIEIIEIMPVPGM
jgi:YCII-related domain